MQEIRDCFGKLVCMADAATGTIERMTSTERICVLLPLGGRFAFETKSAYTEVERVQECLFRVNSFPN